MATPGTRTRSKGVRTSVSFKTHYVDPTQAPYPLIIDGAYSYPIGGTVESMTDVVTPDFQRIMAKGGIVNSPMKKTKREYTWSQNTVTTDSYFEPPASVGVYSTYSGPLLSGRDYLGTYKYTDNTPLSLDSHDRITNNGHIVSVRAAANARTNVNPLLVQSAVSLAELGKTVRLVSNGARTLARLAKAVKNGRNYDEIYDLINGIPAGRIGRTGQTALGASKRWLEYRYGWRILVMEIQGVLKALQNVRPDKPRFTARSTQNLFSQDSYSKSYAWSVAGTTNFRIDASEDVTARAYVVYEADLKYQQARDWGVFELPLAAWELIPFSFILDWFIPVGKWLEAITPKVGINILAEGVVLTTTRLTRRTIVSQTDPTSGYYKSRLTGHIGSYDEVLSTTKERSIGFAPLLNRPYVDVRLNVARAIDAVAILATVGRGLGTSIRR